MKITKSTNSTMSHNSYEQEQNTAKLVMNTFNKLANKNGVSANDIAQYLKDKYGDVWKFNSLCSKAEETLNRSKTLGFLEKQGDRYVADLARDAGCCRRRRPRCRRRRRCCRRRRCPRRRRRRPCCC